MKRVEINKFNVEQFIGKKLYTSYSGYAGQVMVAGPPPMA